MKQGIIDLQGYLSRRSFNRLKSQFYVYSTLYTHNFEMFKDAQLNSAYGKKSHFDKINLLVEQDLIKTFSPEELTGTLMRPNNIESYQEIEQLLTEVHNQNWNASESLDSSSNISDKSYYANIILETSRKIIPLRERLYSLLYREKNNLILNPTTSLDCYSALDIPAQKSDIYRVLIEKFPIPGDDVPLIDIIQYREEESNQVRFLRLQTWVNKISKSGLTVNEIEDEIDTLIMEYQKDMELSGMKMKLARFEFAVKIAPSLIENIIKLNFSKLIDPVIKLRMEKISLLKAEHNAKGNELSYVINA